MSSTITALTSGGGLAMAGDTSGQLELKTNNGTTAATINTAQDVLVGGTTAIDGGVGIQVGSTSAGNAKSTLQLLGNTNSWVQFGNGLSGASRYLGWVQYNYASNYMTFATNSTERMRITSDASILIAKTASSFSTAGFEVAGDGSTYITKTHADSGGAELYLNRLNVNGPTVYFYKDTSNVGNISVTGSATAYNTSSDYRLKEDIAPMTNALATVSALKPVTYKWKLDGSVGQGFIAHELAEVTPDAVTGEKDAVDAEGNPQYQGVDTSFLVATLTAAIQELNAKVDAQALEIQALKGVA